MKCANLTRMRLSPQGNSMYLSALLTADLIAIHNLNVRISYLYIICYHILYLYYILYHILYYKLYLYIIYIIFISYIIFVYHCVCISYLYICISYLFVINNIFSAISSFVFLLILYFLMFSICFVVGSTFEWYRRNYLPWICVRSYSSLWNRGFTEGQMFESPFFLLSHYSVYF